ncbi:DUF692 domain-containing protein [Maricurvus nonylphenolicus]|uniref:DUF692 domain-containing protein n=1 Tax=Maricurvus nonylphenolicus TaxID=1008307 RepID=UPI0036F1ED50
MSRSSTFNQPSPKPSSGWVGVGLRHAHYGDAMSGTSAIDFVEVHAENFFAQGGASLSLLQDVSERYPLSLHSTSLGLGSASGINAAYLEKLALLTERVNPVLISDHACFTWSQLHGHSVHAGDLLPLEYSARSLQLLIDNVDRVQQHFGRQILVENVSAYIAFNDTTMSEAEFLVALAQRSGCGLLVDLNNVLVNAHNFPEGDPLTVAKQWVDAIPSELIGELHLAGYTPSVSPELIIDDHSQAVSEECWALYEYTIQRTGPIATLIEWDNDLPAWPILVAEALKARCIIDNVFYAQEGASHVA